MLKSCCLSLLVCFLPLDQGLFGQFSDAIGDLGGKLGEVDSASIIFA
jgi:hypothetical protein